MVHPRQVEVKRRGHMHIHPSKQLVRWTSSFKLAYVTVAGIFRHPLQGMEMV